MKKYILATLLATSALSAKELEMRPAKLVKADAKHSAATERTRSMTTQQFSFEQNGSKYIVEHELWGFTSTCRLVVGKTYEVGVDPKKHVLRLVDDEGKKRSLRIVGEEIVSQ